MNYLIIKLITFYQHTFSPDHGFIFLHRYPYGYCRHYPSCSEYAKIQFQNRPFFIALFKTIGRIVKCNPFQSITIEKY